MIKIKKVPKVENIAIYSTNAYWSITLLLEGNPQALFLTLEKERLKLSVRSKI